MGKLRMAAPVALACAGGPGICSWLSVSAVHDLEQHNPAMRDTGNGLFIVAGVAGVASVAGVFKVGAGAVGNAKLVAPPALSRDRRAELY